MQLFISHSSKDRQWVDLVCKRIETAGFAAYQAEYDHSGIGHDLGSKIQDAIKNSIAVIVLLTKSASESPIVRDEIGFAMGRGTGSGTGHARSCIRSCSTWHAER